MEKEKVIIVTPGRSIFTGPFQRAFEKRGFECLLFDHRQGIVFTNRTVRRFIHIFPILKFLKRWQVAKTNRLLLKLVEKNHPKYLFAQKGDSIYPETILAIRAKGVITMNFYNDFINLWENIKSIAPAYDMFFSPDHHVLRELERADIHNGHYLPVAVETNGSCPEFEDYKYDVTFIGTHNPKIYHNRERFLLAIKGMGLNIWGNESWSRSSLKECFHGRAYGDQRFDIYKKSKIVIDINFDEWSSEAISMRPFEVGYCGACLFSDTIRADLSRVFEPNKDFVTFSNEHELRDKIKYYLNHNEERLTIAQSCQSKVIASHTYDVRVGQILDIVNKELHSKPFNDIH